MNFLKIICICILLYTGTVFSQSLSVNIYGYDPLCPDSQDGNAHTQVSGGSHLTLTSGMMMKTVQPLVSMVWQGEHIV